jgi:hypothetical protein
MARHADARTEVLMRYAKTLALALTLAGCAESDHDGPSAWIQAAGNLPPPLYADCVDYVLLDDRCVSHWYACMREKNDRSACAYVWEGCCTLPGRGHRQTMASVRAVER